jgi:amino acid adenylation domain-containing protein
LSATATVPDLFERSVAVRPDTPAVVSAGRTLTYAELDERVNRLGHHLQGLSVGPDVVVGIFLERSLELVVALLGVLKAGGVCLPLDPSYPAERLAFMLDDSRAPVLVTTRDLLGRLPAHDARTLCLDADWDEVARRPPSRPDRAATPEHLAYVIYTSGSTGEPKGVMLPHRGLVNHNRAAAHLYELAPGDRVLQFCSISFDVSIEELFPTWAAGATAVLRSDDVPILGPAWGEWLRSQGVTVLNLPTAYWHEWVRDLESRGQQVPAGVRLVVAGGEKALGTAYRTWLGVGGDRVRWVNAYGPAEASVMATAWSPAVGEALVSADPPIGRAVTGATVHVLDPAGRPVPTGEAGELYVGGEGLARGYLRRPALTAERFVPDPFSGRPGARLYRTGDAVRELPGGDLEFVDRLDHQLKVRGFRIESGEVEAALTAHPGVAEAAVVAREDTPGDKRLVAYVVGPGGAPAPAAGDLRAFVAERLPAYMVPGAFVAIDAFPLTPNGKVDRAALPAPGHARPDLATPWVAPATVTEQRLAAIWSTVLGIEGIGAYDDFFALGGHSLLATQVIARAREAFGADLPLRAIFEAPTVAGLAAAIEASDGRQTSVPPLRPEPRPPGTRIPLTLAQEQMLGLELEASPPGLYNVTALHRFTGPADPGVLRRALEYMVERHETLRTGFVVDDLGPHQEIAPTVPVELAVSEIVAGTEEARGAELRRRVVEHDSRPFDLASPPLFRAELIGLGTAASQLVVTFDHLICDMTSAYIFLGELATAYDALADGRAPELSPLPIQFADYALWQRRWLTEERLADQLGYWREVLDGMPLGPAVPFDRTPEKPSRRIAQRAFSVPPEVHAPLREVGRRASATMFVVCVAATEAVLSRHGGVTDVVLSTTLSGRQRNECEGLIGMFAGVGRIRTDLSGDPTFRAIAERARDAVLGLFEHQDVPFMKVRDVLFPDFPRSGEYARTAAVIPIELLYFHAAHDHWAPGSGVVERPGGQTGVDEIHFRGQLQPLSLTFVDDGRQLWGHLSYKLDFYDEATVEALASSLERVLRAVGSDPGLRLSELPVTVAVRD